MDLRLYGERHRLEALRAYPAEQWRLALERFPPPSGRPPASFWRRQREQAIAWLASHGVPVREDAGKVYIGETFVDGSYVG